MYSNEVIEALAILRQTAFADGAPTIVSEAINTLDNAGVFHEIDEQTHYDVYPTPDMES